MANIILSLLVIILIILLVISYYTNMSLKEKRNNLRNEFVSQNKLFLDNIATMVLLVL